MSVESREGDRLSRCAIPPWAFGLSRQMPSRWASGAHRCPKSQKGEGEVLSRPNNANADARKQANRVRLFPINTCPASRHVRLMAECLWKGETYHMFADEPEHCAGSMYSTLASLWEARTALEALRPDGFETVWWWQSPEGKKHIRAVKRQRAKP